MTALGPAPEGSPLVAVADATPVFLQGLVAVLTVEGYEVAGAGTGPEVQELLARDPDALLVDLRLVNENPALVSAAREREIPLIVSVSNGDEGVLDLVQDGVSGLWDRDGDAAELRRIVAGVLAGAPVISAEVGAGLLHRIARASEAARGTAGRLTQREREILELMADGVGNRAIADSLFISENTVRNHVRNVLDKLQARTRTEAVVRAVRAGLIRLT